MSRTVGRVPRLVLLATPHRPMLSVMRKLLVPLLLLAGCSSTPNVTGNALGGVMPWSGKDESAAFKAAQAHCQNFGKSARITQITQPTDSGKGTAVFVCEAT